MTDVKRSSGLILPSRRTMLKLVGAAGLMVVNPALGALRTTPSSTPGPYYPRTKPDDNDVDLTQVAGQSKPAVGQVIEVVGRVLDKRGGPLADSFVEIWQADTFGVYHHPYDAQRQKADPGFQGYGVARTGRDGAYRFRTIMPKKYGTGPFVRTPHIHFRIIHDTAERLVTQMYFPDEALNEFDPLFNFIRDKADRAAVTARMMRSDAVVRYQFDIVV